MTYHHGWLYLTNALGDPVEIFNHARTVAYLNNVGLPGFSVTAYVDEVCPAYSYAPCVVDDETGDVTEWVPLTYTTPSDTANPAPWFDGVSGSASSEGLGFLVSEWTGLDEEHLTRSSAQIGARPGGMRFGPLMSKGRTWKLNVALFASSERGMVWLYRWLAETLAQCCQPCEGMEAWIRLTCPDSDPEDDVVKATNLELLEGPTWNDPPIEDAGCYIREVSFTIGVGDPCLYSPEASVATGLSLDPTAIIASRTDIFPRDPLSVKAVCRPDVDAFGGSERLVVAIPPVNQGQVAPIVRIRTAVDGGCPELRIRGLEDLTGVGPDPNMTRVRGEICTTRLPAASELWIDFGRRQVLYQARGQGGMAVPGWALVDLNAPAKSRWFSFTCFDGYLVIELNSRCYDMDGLTVVDEDGNDMGFSDNPITVDVWTVRRQGCC